MEPSARHLAFHGAVVLLFGLLCGGPYARAVNKVAPPHIVPAWRVEHASLPMGAILMISVSLAASSYAFCLSLPLEAAVGHCGLSSGGPLSARLVYAGNMLGAGASLVGAVALVYASLVSL
ncbi:MAG: hypothetical protein H7306_02410 [Bacteriovorax sp.]|nr:hypothetical protein [Rhizobacter sp.]